MDEVLITLVGNVTETILSLLCIVFGCVIIPRLSEYLKNKTLYDKVKKYVGAAEKLAERNNIDKKDYVLSLLKESGITANAFVVSMIESAVGELDREKNKLK